MIKEKLIIGGRKRNIYTGSKGGKYYMKDGNKRYINNKMKGGSGYKYIPKNGSEIKKNITLEEFLEEAKLNQYSNLPLSLNDIKKKSNRYYEASTNKKEKDKIWRSLGITKKFHAIRLLKFAQQLIPKYKYTSKNEDIENINKDAFFEIIKLTGHKNIPFSLYDIKEKSNEYNEAKTKEDKDRIWQSLGIKKEFYARRVLREAKQLTLMSNNSSNSLLSNSPSPNNSPTEGKRVIFANQLQNGKLVNERIFPSLNNSSNNSSILSLKKVEKQYNSNGKIIYVNQNGKKVTKNKYNNYVKNLGEIQAKCEHDFRLKLGNNGTGWNGRDTYVCIKCGFQMSETNYNNKYVKPKQANCEHVIEEVHSNTHRQHVTLYSCKKCDKNNFTKNQYNNFIAKHNTTEEKCSHAQIRRRIDNSTTLNRGLFQKLEYYCLDCKKVCTKQQYNEAKINNKCEHSVDFAKTNTINSGNNQGTYYKCKNCQDYVEKGEYNNYVDKLLNERFKGVDKSQAHMKIPN